MEYQPLRPSPSSLERCSPKLEETSSYHDRDDKPRRRPLLNFLVVSNLFLEMILLVLVVCSTLTLQSLQSRDTFRGQVKHQQDQKGSRCCSAPAATARRKRRNMDVSRYHAKHLGPSFVPPSLATKVRFLLYQTAGLVRQYPPKPWDLAQH
jgi:hypothetical protein